MPLLLTRNPIKYDMKKQGNSSGYGSLMGIGWANGIYRQAIIHYVYLSEQLSILICIHLWG